MNQEFRTTGNYFNGCVVSILNNSLFYVIESSYNSVDKVNYFEIGSDYVGYNSGDIHLFAGVVEIPLNILLINDPDAPAISTDYL